MTIFRLKILATIIFALALRADAAGYRKPRNPRRAKGKPAASAERPAAKKDAAGLPPRRWDPGVREAVELAAQVHGVGDAVYDPETPPVAVLSWNGAVVDGDVAEVVFQRLVTRAEFKFSDAWWRVVPLAYGRQRLRAAYEDFSTQPQATWPSQPSYQVFRKGMLTGYRSLCEAVGRKDCRVYLARLLSGFRFEEAREYAATAIREEMASAGTLEAVRGSPEDEAPLALRRGLAVVPEIKDLVAFLGKRGFETRVVDATAQPVLEAAAAELGFDAARVSGIVAKRDKEVLLDEIVEPVPVRGGKVEAVLGKTGRTPIIVVGAGPDDADLLGYGNGLRVLIDHGDPRLKALADEKGWRVQPAFAR